MDLLDQEYGVKRGGAKGNASFTTFDGLKKVSISKADTRAKFIATSRTDNPAVLSVHNDFAEPENMICNIAQSDWSYGVETDFPLGDLIANPVPFKITDTEFFTNTSLTITPATGSFNDVVYIGNGINTHRF